MKDELRETMRKDLLVNKRDWWVPIATAMFLGIAALGRKIPGMAELVRGHQWPIYVAGTIALIGGLIARSVLEHAAERQLKEYDDDDLKVHYDAMKRRGLVKTILMLAFIAFLFITYSGVW